VPAQITLTGARVEDVMAVTPIIDLRHDCRVADEPVDDTWNLASPTAIGTNPADPLQVVVAA